MSGWGFSWYDPTLTDVEVANMALAEVGGQKIDALEDRDDVSLPKIFNQTRDELLSKFPWAFGKGRKVLYPSPVELANSLKALMNSHAADTAMHDTADTTNFPITTDDATDLDTLYTLVEALIAAYDAHESDSELAGSWAFHRAQELADVTLDDTTTPTTQAEAVTCLNDLRTKFNAHDADNVSHTAFELNEETKEECGVPDFEYDYEYYLPSDYMGGAELYGSDAKIIIEGNRILSNDDSLNIKYRKRADNASIYSRLYTGCLIKSLASKLAILIAHDRALAAQKSAELQAMLYEAMATDAYEGDSEPSREDTSWQSH